MIFRGKEGYLPRIIPESAPASSGCIESSMKISLLLSQLANMTEYSLYDCNQLIKLLSQGDEMAFTEIYRRFWKKLYAIAYNRLKEAETAEDVVHDVFVSLWANRQKNEIQLLENYLGSAVKYMVLARLRKIERERVYRQSGNTAVVIESSVEHTLHYKRILEVIKTEVELLPEKCQLVFKYSRYEGLNTRQIAETLHISPKTVENQLSKALKQLKLVTRSFLHFF